MIYNFYGIHTISEIYDVDNEKINNEALIIESIELGIKKSGASLVQTYSFRFAPMGLTIFSILKESHVSIHTYPEKNAAFIDAFTCGDIDPEIIVQTIIDFLLPKKVYTKTIERGIKDISF